MSVPNNWGQPYSLFVKSGEICYLDEQGSCQPLTVGGSHLLVQGFLTMQNTLNEYATKLEAARDQINKQTRAINEYSAVVAAFEKRIAAMPTLKELLVEPPEKI